MIGLVTIVCSSDIGKCYGSSVSNLCIEFGLSISDCCRVMYSFGMYLQAGQGHVCWWS